MSSGALQPRSVAIIPLGPRLLRDSSSLPEGYSRTAFGRLGRTKARRTGRASPPLLFGLAPRGVFRASRVATRAVGSYPTFSPLPDALDRKRRAFGITSSLPQRPLLTGGFFSVALSVATPRDALSLARRTTPWRYQARRPNGVRTFLPSTLPPVKRDSGSTGDRPTHPLRPLYARQPRSPARPASPMDRCSVSGAKPGSAISSTACPQQLNSYRVAGPRALPHAAPRRSSIRARTTASPLRWSRRGPLSQTSPPPRANRP